MSVKVCKHGNSLSIRLGAHITRLTNLKAGDYVSVRLLDSGDIQVRPVKEAVPAHPDDGSKLTHEDQASAKEQW